MRIGLLTTSFPRFAGDVPGQFVLGFAQALAARGHTIEVLAPEPHDALTRELPSFEGLTLHWVRYAPPTLERTFYGAGVLDNLQRDPRAWLGLAPFVAALSREVLRRRAGWAAIVSHWALPCGLVAALTRGARPHLAVLHSADVFLLERLPYRRALAARVGNGASALVCSSRKLRERYLALLDPIERVQLAARTHVCAMGIEPTLAPQGSVAAPSDRLRLLSLGRLVPIKGIQHAIRAVARLSDVELVIAGDGPMRGELEQLARSLAAPVRFVGEVRAEAKRALLASAHAFVLPSVALSSGRTEGMPTSVLEAMDAGLAVIASRTGGLGDLVEHELNGLLVASGDEAALMAAIERVREPAFRARLAHAGKNTAEDFHWSRLAPHFEQLLRGGAPEDARETSAAEA
jgi:glycosyltransferase involved in cell wall biosynthesis